MSCSPWTYGRRTQTATFTGAAFVITRPWRRYAWCSLMMLIGLSDSVLLAQSSHVPRSLDGPTFPGQIVRASASESAAEAAEAPTFIETVPVIQQADHRIHLIPTGQQQLDVILHRSQLISTTGRVRRIHIADPSVLEVIQFSENEFSLIGLALGTTDLTFWFEGSGQPLLYVANVVRDPAIEDQRRIDYGRIERKLALLYPNSKVFLIALSRKIIVRGQAKDAEEAARIMQIVRGEVFAQDPALFAGYYGNVNAAAANVAATPAAAGVGYPGGFGGGYGGVLGGGPLSSILVNELEVPGEFQIMLRVRIAELNRSQLRRLGIDWSVIWNDARNAVVQTFATTAPVLTGLFDNGEVTVLLDWLASNGSAKILEDSVVVTMSGSPASFLSGGEFAVPNTVGNNGVLVGTTTFRGFGTSIIATPTVIDDDLLRLQVIPELSAINDANSVNGIPGVDVRRVQTVVELREGQTIVLGGLFSRRQQAEVTRIPILGELPLIGAHLFNTKQATEDETELLIVVTPEIVRPMDPEEVPPLPGFYVTHPDDFDLCKFNRTEGNPDLGPYRLLPYGNGTGFGENVGYGVYNPGYQQFAVPQEGVPGPEHSGSLMGQEQYLPQSPAESYFAPPMGPADESQPTYLTPQPQQGTGSPGEPVPTTAPTPAPPEMGFSRPTRGVIQQTGGERPVRGAGDQPGIGWRN